jgi:hypothetical protein
MVRRPRRSTLLLLPLTTGVITVATAQLADRNRFNIHKETQQTQQQRTNGRRTLLPSGDLPLPSLSLPWEDHAVQDSKLISGNKNDEHDGQRELSSQLSGCCYNYQKYSASDLCALYGNDCDSGESPSHDSGDASCSLKGLSFIGLSFSVNTLSGNPYSYQLCDQFPMENIIDRDYEYVMSMDEDGWLVGGGYKTFDYSGKMPYVLVLHFCY